MRVGGGRTPYMRGLIESQVQRLVKRSMFQHQAAPRSLALADSWPALLVSRLQARSRVRICVKNQYFNQIHAA
jgi:hypothetical protein